MYPLNILYIKYSTHGSKFLRRFSLPYPDVHLVGSAEQVLVIEGPPDAGEALHALGVVHVPGVALQRLEDAERLVVGGGHQLLAGGGVVKVYDSCHVVLVHVDGVLQVAGVKCV